MVSDLRTLGQTVREFIALEPIPAAASLTQVTMESDEVTAVCLTGDTLIDIACNEEKYPKGVPIRDLVGTEGYVFGFDTESNKPVCRQYHSVRMTRTSTKVVRVHLEKFRRLKNKFLHEPAFIDVTPDHEFLVYRLHEGWGGFRSPNRWVAAKNLNIGDRCVVSQRSGDSIRGVGRHILLAEAVFGTIPHRYHVHHKDHQHSNNAPGNLQVLTVGEHASYHRSVQYGYDSSLEIAELVAQYESGESAQSLAKVIGCDPGTIRDRLRGKVVFRSHSEQLAFNYSKTSETRESARLLYEQGYTLGEVADYLGVHSTTVRQWVLSSNYAMRKANDTRKARKTNPLPALNHRIVGIEELSEVQDVYNMEVEDVQNFFANEVLVHNCPVTGQPDWYTVTVVFTPDKYCLESKSLKLYLQSFRDKGIFSEDFAAKIAEDVAHALQPWNGSVTVRQKPRGGVSIVATAGMPYRGEGPDA